MRCTGERVLNDITILDVSSPAMLGDLSNEVTERVKALTREGRRGFVLDMSAVTSLDSRGLGDLVGAQQVASRTGATVKLLQVHERVAEPLRIMHLSRLFETFDTEQAAVRSFESPST